MSATFANYAPALKEMVRDKIEDCTYGASPLLALMTRKTDFYGESYRIPIQTEAVQGSGGQFGRAQAAAAASRSVLRAFSVTHGGGYSVARVSGQLIRRGSKQSVIKAMEFEVENAMKTAECDLSHELYRAGYGSRGTIVYTSGTSFACTNAADVTHFKEGMRLLCSQSESGHVLVSSTPATITSVDEDSNVITTDTTLSSLGWTTGYHVFRDGDRENSASPSRVVWTGLGGWNPVTTPSATAFFNVDRSTAPNRLAGGRWSPSSYSPEELLIDIIGRGTRRGGKFTHIVCHPDFYRVVAKVMQSRGQVPLVDVKTAKPQVGFRGINIVSPDGDVTLLSDIYCPPREVRAVNIESLQLLCAGSPVQLADPDADNIRANDEDTYEVRFAREGQYAVTRPLDTFVAYLPAAIS